MTTDGIHATHAELKPLGVDAGVKVLRMGDPVPPLFWVRDLEVTLTVVEQR